MWRGPRQGAFFRWRWLASLSTLDMRVLSNPPWRPFSRVAATVRGDSLPTYEYHCQSCKATYELRQGFDAETTHPCEECGKGTAKRVLHAPPVVFKGSGWYVTDSRNKTSAVSDTSSESSPADSPAESSPAAASTPAPSSETPAAS